ncbi:phosphodiester glycosidase family protein [Botrimarina hoheduenensis]|uniref:Phosphodiester glycosidase domain-containing protein n=1 Tax=Botrimarina hoheduenensis TaxID=2528000 RepID=A0A5C5WEF8_9BACT|nr:phosphodiester glycosidase family protein [Botrimarina hoheduenensis]TWT48435.1 hypothetical protein Pla111_02030 [Botrimarina hoheduenensis]
MRIRVAVACLMFALVGESRADTPPFDLPETIGWRDVFEGIAVAELTLTQPRPLRVHLAKVDLLADGVSVVANSDNGERPDEVDGCYTTTFLEQQACQIAINGAPFGPGRAKEGETQDVSGLVVSHGVVVSPIEVPGEPDRAALVFRGPTAAIESPPIDLSGVSTAVGGFGVVLAQGKVVRDETTPEKVLDGVHPRSAFALRRGGAELLLLVVDGRQPGYSEGVTLEELGKMIGLLGYEEGLNLDGGGTTSLAIANETGKAVLLNRPINDKQPGQQRVAASHLGVFARSLPVESKPTSP